MLRLLWIIPYVLFVGLPKLAFDALYWRVVDPMPKKRPDAHHWNWADATAAERSAWLAWHDRNAARAHVASGEADVKWQEQRRGAARQDDPARDRLRLVEPHPSAKNRETPASEDQDQARAA